MAFVLLSSIRGTSVSAAIERGGFAALEFRRSARRRNFVHNDEDQGNPMSVGSSNCGSGREILELERDQLVVELCRVKQPRLRVLVVEDEPDAQTLLRFILEPKYEVITAS